MASRKSSATDNPWATIKKTTPETPKAVPQAIIDKLNAKVVEILNSPDVKARFASGGVSTIPSSPSGLAAKIKREAAAYRVIVEKANVHVD